MADRERLERVAAQVFAALAARDEGDSFAADARSAFLAAEAFLRECDLRNPPEPPAAPTPDEPTLLEAAKALIYERDSHQVDNRVALAVAWQDLRAAIAREEARRG